MHNQFSPHAKPRTPPPPPLYRRAFDQLNWALAQEAPFDNTEKIALIRRIYFSDVDELEASGEVDAVLREADQNYSSGNSPAPALTNPPTSVEL